MKTFFKAAAAALAAFVAFSVVSAPAMAKQPKFNVAEAEAVASALAQKAHNYALFALTYEQVYNDNPTEYNRMQALKAATVAKQAAINAAAVMMILEKLKEESAK